MGFIRNNYAIKNMGITLPIAYAQITSLDINADGQANALFSIQQSREDILKKDNIEIVMYRCEINKDLPVYKQIYEKAKEEIFVNWEDDIV